MARVVQRSGPPYLTILFAFLFFVSAAVAAWLGTVAQNRGKEVTKLQETVNTLGQFNDPQMAAVKERAGSRSVIGQMRADTQKLIEGLVGPAAGRGMSVAAALRHIDQARQAVQTANPDEPATRRLAGEIDRIAEQLRSAGGEGMNVTEALAQIDAARQAFAAANPDETAADGVLTILQRVGEELKSARQQIATLEAQNTELADDLRASRRSAGEARKDLAAKLDQANDQLSALQKKLDDLSDSYDQRITTANDDWEGRVRDLQDDLTTREQEIRTLEGRVRDLLARVDELEDRVRGERRGPETELTADGRIIEVVPEHELVYISLGREDNVRVGLPFSVYAKETGVSAEGESKGRIIVKNVYDAVAECHVVRTTPGEPIVKDDLIANIAFSTVTQPKFYIVGQFDLNDDGEVDDDSLEAVRNMIARFGGSLVDEISVQTDYVVMGHPPRPIPRPASDATPTQVALWEQLQERIEAYQSTQKLAMQFNKPILNARQFMSFIGYTPDVLQP